MTARKREVSSALIRSITFEEARELLTRMDRWLSGYDGSSRQAVCHSWRNVRGNEVALGGYSECGHWEDDEFHELEPWWVCTKQVFKLEVWEPVTAGKPCEDEGFPPGILIASFETERDVRALMECGRFRGDTDFPQYFLS